MAKTTKKKNPTRGNQDRQKKTEGADAARRSPRAAHSSGGLPRKSAVVRRSGVGHTRHADVDGPAAVTIADVRWLAFVLAALLGQLPLVDFASIPPQPLNDASHVRLCRFAAAIPL